MIKQTKTHQIHTLPLPMPFGMGKVNAYLVETSKGCTLIDTGSASARKSLLAALADIGCTAGKLKLVILTHGDFDHTGNAAYLQKTYGVRVGMGAGDAAMATQGDMFSNRKQPNWFIRKLLPPLTGFGRAERFTPDLLVVDGQDLAEFGLEAKILSLPGHSHGSIGILTGAGDLFCGDLFENLKGPRLNSIMDEPETAERSLARLKEMQIATVHPGHGEPFPFEALKG